jgi:ABC-2 type transport system ATP-binding protein
MHILLDKVTAGYGRVTVLKDLSWQVGPGVTGLLGPNGAGKTTLLHLLAGITRPARGIITARRDQASVTSDHTGYARRIGFVPQHFTFAGELTVQDTVSYAAWIHGVPKRSCATAGASALALVDLTKLAPSRVRTLSGGQRQRLGVATALAHDPDVLLLDEPTVGLDPTQRLRLRDVIATIGRDRPVILSTHLIEDVTHLCSRVGILVGGRMAFDDDVNALASLISSNNAAPAHGSAFEQAYAGIVAGLVDNDE